LTAYYRRIKMLQEPNDALGLDKQNRPRWSFNISIEKSPSSVDYTGLELTRLLQTAGLGTEGVDLWTSRRAAIPPDGAGPYTQVLINPGAAPEMIQNQDAPFTERPNAQVIVRATSNAVARARARAVYNALAVVKNQTLSTA
jgi:hypothetical protein